MLLIPLRCYIGVIRDCYGAVDDDGVSSAIYNIEPSPNILPIGAIEWLIGFDEGGST